MRMLSFILALLVLLPAAARANDPWDFKQPARKLAPRTVVFHDRHQDSSHPVKRGLGSMVKFFQDYLSPLDGPKCPHYPTCSQFSRESLSLYGPFWGVVMTANRLTREYDGLLESGHYQLVYKGKVRAYDPPEQAWYWGDYLNSFEE